MEGITDYFIDTVREEEAAIERENQRLFLRKKEPFR